MNPFLLTALGSAALSIVGMQVWLRIEESLSCDFCNDRRRRRVEAFCLNCDNTYRYWVCNDCDPEPECEDYHEVAVSIF
jgi:hypothetical protein